MKRTGRDLVARTAQGDCYSTPAWATEALLDYTDSHFSNGAWPYYSGTILEPACGVGAMVEVLRGRGMTVAARDIQPVPGLDWFNVQDFLSAAYQPDTYTHVITNPPYSLAIEFVKRALVVATDTVTMFLRLQFLEGGERHWFFQDHPPTYVLIFSSRVTLWPVGHEEPEHSKRGGTVAYAWFIWDKSLMVPGRPPEIHWIAPLARSQRMS